MNTFLRSFLEKIIRTGQLTVIGSAGDRVELGDGTGQPLVVRFNSPAAERATVTDPALKLGECYMEGEIDMVEGSIYDVIMLVYTNTGRNPMPAVWMKLFEKMRISARRLHQLNTPLKSRGNVQRHYDLSADLYRMFLDPDMQYSCAYFPTPETPLAEAQLLKKRHIAAKLRLGEGMDVLDIGCGWGGMGLYLAKVAGARVEGVTLSDEQLAVAARRVEREGLSDRVDFRIEDYRAITRSYDRIVSVGMFEHVGINHYDRFFRKSAEMLRPEGTMLLHTIGRTEPPGATNPFVRKYIFPGGYIPALSELMASVEKSGLIVTDVEILRLHYAETLKAWRESFMERREEAKALYDEAFCRMWEFYLAGSEASFREGMMVVFQLQIAHRNDAVPVTRDYIAEAEAQLARAETERGIPGPAWPEDWTGEGGRRQPPVAVQSGTEAGAETPAAGRIPAAPEPVELERHG
ncbi:SAM-dependent methyltransferase [Celeribacter indicus]|uniref:Cyclopropane-fatty-acyl-phospholipid synthase n=1 Tax=Celeribacter indicus TaxID=1208324 RepID=A0A0B5E2Y8_9RHOB|nr:cyclopropane-fatty-acyl-phospholipid synthase family protein [Celeribacter indicus]AJE47730.1 cyclopropane-fatty-acyl-phospholipid synthase [Celeribacter indicus]SDW15460.1 cyclopropane-fatty-acyl-phospholipid synthase [Celeribacter indicus]